MPPKKDIKKKKKPLKQKQKQKQIVKQNVRVNVQSSGGSGAGGTSVPAPSPIPYNYFDRTGENVQIKNLVEEAVRRQAIPRVVQLPSDAPISQPANDATTFNALFNAPSDLDRPLVAGRGAVGEIKKRTRGPNKPKIIAYAVESGAESGVSRAGTPPSMRQFQEPTGFPARSRYLAELEAKQKLGEM